MLLHIAPHQILNAKLACMTGKSLRYARLSSMSASMLTLTIESYTVLQAWLAACLHAEALHNSPLI